jgi:hypothetical protein
MLLYNLFLNSDPVPFAFSGNMDSMKKALHTLQGTPKAQVAESLLAVFRDCSKEKQDQRVGDFRSVIDRLHDILDVLQYTDPDVTIEWEDFCVQLRYELIGLVKENGYRSVSEFSTASGRTRIELLPIENAQPEQSLKVRFYLIERPFMEGLESHEVVQTLNKRLDDTLRDFPEAKRRAGNTGPYEAFVVFKYGCLNLRTVERVRRAITLVVDVLERH